MANNYNYLFKYIIIGNPSVGKSNMLMKYCHNKFTDDYQATIGVEFGAKNIEFDEQVFRIQIWDTAGQDNFRSITRAYYNNSVCAIVVYDISNRKSFEDVLQWVEDVKNQSPKTVLIVLVGNKSDLEEERKVTKEEGQNFAIEHRLMFLETSAKNGDNIEELFKSSAKTIAKRMSENYYDLTSEGCGIKKGSSNRVMLSNGKPSKINLGDSNIEGEAKKGCC